ncbi:RHS repeat-associated core domain-containing protein [Streptomyces sp. NPDC017966]|uniref:RHS repeat-associated core domain-containing protein n=1 Tax=Streptomyces sp. NPDC017966 TaxID=3365023 RepID=UPI00379C3EAC
MLHRRQRQPDATCAYADPTGLHRMGHRCYDPTLGRFTQPDPPARKPTPYPYAAGGPVNGCGTGKCLPVPQLSCESEGNGTEVRRKEESMNDAVRGVRTFSAVLMTGGIYACVAGTVTDDAVPIVLGLIAAVSGAVLAVLAFLAHRKTRS